MQTANTNPAGITGALSLDEIIVDCADPETLAIFWSQALGYEISESDPEVASIEHPTETRPCICFQRVPESKSHKNRIHFDLSVDEHLLDDAVAHLIALGATHVDVGQGPNCSWVVLADPELNEFCIIT